MAKERFEAWLTAEEARQVRDDMRQLGKRHKADYVRNCLLAGTAGRAEHLSYAVGSLGLAVDDWLAVARESSPQTGSPALPPHAARLTVRLVRLVKEVQVLVDGMRSDAASS